MPPPIPPPLPAAVIIHTTTLTHQHTNTPTHTQKLPEQVGIDRPVRLAQAKEVRIRIKSFLPGQVRGTAQGAWCDWLVD